ncbi:hypothetical protein GCM10017714_01020 [Curtobacterium pusillum]|uniref:DNA-binding MarR family transcriptional regulator n=1 Tax=Curtobacterium pusillum TaxID=69373 RepID=A0AAW3T947_9MICO|nr:MarR family winged helix-turn-helix transcriptional regulator [Curtobacterium pusillum]MBA8991148.1 DNA-binding MarR family transcriptional regulator [Curtobacterium pusillum]NUU15262.1 winged helix-turn-helix transcriptional regulator [Curtobacterium pusillum]GLK31405.1 hypothetical protein GCM10017610_16900 [Curtobacterium pusillum]
MATTDDDAGIDYADLAEIVLTVAREIRLRETDLGDTISLTPSNTQVMRYIDTHPGATPSETAEATGLLRSNLSTAIRELEQIGFIEKRRDEHDGRGVRLHSTPTAVANLARVRERWAEDAARVLGKPTGVPQATKLLRRLGEGLADERRRSGARWKRNQM